MILARSVISCLLLLAPTSALAALSVNFTSKPAQNQPVGSSLRFMVSASGAGADPVLYRFEIAVYGGAFRLQKDYYVLPYTDWAPTEEGVYVIKVKARNWVNGETAEVITGYQATARITSAAPVVNSTQNPLVALYSTPPCPSGEVRVLFQAVGTSALQATPLRPCVTNKTLNIYVAGMRPQTTYAVRHEWINNGSSSLGPVLTFRTGASPADLPTAALLVPPNAQTSITENVLLHSRTFNVALAGPDYPFATDLLGRLIWYHRPTVPVTAQWTTITKPLPGGTFLMTAPFNLLREFDLAGNTIRETSTFAVARQLQGQVADPIGAFHHEAVRLPNGHTLVIASVERLVTDVQGPGAVDVLGDIVIDLDEDWNAVWYWNSLDRLDLSRKAVLDEKCNGPTTGCAFLTLASEGNDWTHSNSIHYDPTDGNVLISIRHQDWVVKVDYRNGAGTGSVLWRMGRGGDFAISPSNDPDLWFTHQHDITYKDNRLIVYDNGNTRHAANASVNSRGQVFVVNENLRQVTLELNKDLGHYADAFGSGQKLTNGNYQFLSGILQPDLHSEVVEVLPNGQTNYVQSLPTIIYRTFRMKGLYEQ